MDKSAELLDHLLKFERAVYGRDRSDAVERLNRLLIELDRGALVPATASAVEAARSHSRLAAAVVTLLTDPELELGTASLNRLLLAKRTLLDVLAPTPFDSRLIVDLIGARDEEAGTLQLQRSRLAGVMAALSLGQATLMRRVLPRLRPAVRLCLVLGMLCDPIVLTAEEERTRNWLIDHPELFDGAEMMVTASARLASAWMFCSYADHPSRHRLKATLNALIRRWLEAILGREPRVPSRPADSFRSTSAPSHAEGNMVVAAQDHRPVLLVVTERFRAGHAMHRCYAPSIAQLRSRYRVVIIGVKAHLDAASKALADEVIVVDPDPRKFPALVELIEGIAPDMVFYPSIGMSFWVIALANLRLAPIQFMSIGHPASSFSDTIDYMVLGRDVLGDPACFTEIVVVRDAPGNPVQPYPGKLPPPPAPRVNPEVLRIGIPAMATKLCPAFLDMCRRLSEEAGRAVEFHLFPNRSGVSYRHMETSLSKILPGCTVYPSTEYGEYMANLGRCDIALATYPFGNANSTVDSLLLGKPVVALEGDEPAARTDRRMLRLGGAPEWLLTDSRERYFETVLRLVRDDALRVRTAQAILAADPPRALYETESALYPTDFADTVDWLHGNHERIQAAGRKVWLPEDRGLAASDAPEPVTAARSAGH